MRLSRFALCPHRLQRLAPALAAFPEKSQELISAEVAKALKDTGRDQTEHNFEPVFCSFYSNFQRWELRIGSRFCHLERPLLQSLHQDFNAGFPTLVRAVS